MTTSEIGPAALGQLPAFGAPSGGAAQPGRLPFAESAPGVVSTPGDPGSEQGALVGKALERLVNEYFSGFPGSALELPGSGPTPGGGAFPRVAPVAPPSGLLPSAFSVGAGGVSPTSGLVPPVPGFMQQLPPASSPLPKESDLRTAPAVLSELFGVSSPVALAGGHEPMAAAPYFLEIAGLPKELPIARAPQGIPASGESVPGGLPSANGAPSHGALPAPNGLSPGGVPGPGSHPEYGSRAAHAEPRQASYASGLAPGVPEGGFGSYAQRPDEVTLGPSSHAYEPQRAPGLDRSSRRVFDPLSIKRDFPILEERVHGRQLIWLDNAATTQKPRAVIDRISYFYQHENSNIHRAAHTLAARATDAYEGARETPRRFLNAPSVNEIIFARGTTEAINLVAQSWGRRHLQPGDEVLISWLEHHANIVPWQLICSERGARLRVAPVDDTGQVLPYEYEKLLGPRTKLVSLSHVSNALGTIVPVKEMVEMAHRHGAKVLVDGAQAVSHLRVDVQQIDCDFYVFSGHKIFGPTGIGALFGKADVLESMPPWQGGGNMIRDVTFEKTQFHRAPARFEAGTPNIADAVGLGAALDYVSSLGLENIGRYEHELLVYATERLGTVPGLRMFGTAPDKAGVLSFVVDGLKTEELGAALDREGIAVRAGHHCAQPILRRFGVEATVRASLAPYNTCEDIDALVAALQRLRAVRY